MKPAQGPDPARLVPLFARIEARMAQNRRVLLAIDGPSGAGKTTLCALLQTRFDSTAFHMDDFFLRPEQRTPQRLAQPGGNVDYARFDAEVLAPLLRGGMVSYRPYDCAAQALGAPVTVWPRPLCVVEGVYSMHPALAGRYDFSVFLRVDPARQSARILARSGAQMQTRFLAEWIPLENLYFSQTRTQARCSMTLEL